MIAMLNKPRRATAVKVHEPGLVLIVFVGGGSLLGFLGGRLALLSWKRTRHDDTA